MEERSLVMARKKKEETVVENIETVETVEVVEEPTPVVEEKPKKKKATPVAKVNTPALNVRPDASTNNTPVKVLHEGDKVKVVKDLGEWLEIEEGFVMSKFITIK